jgi:hypothetical protein
MVKGIVFDAAVPREAKEKQEAAPQSFFGRGTRVAPEKGLPTDALPLSTTDEEICSIIEKM